MTWRAVALLLGLAALASAQVPPPASAAIAAGPLGSVQAGGVISALGVWQDRPAPGEAGTLADWSNAMVILQKASGPVQFYLQAGAYNIPVVGQSLQSTGDTTRGLFGLLPVVYATFPLGAHCSLDAGVLPTLIGAENTFTFQNVNVLRGLLWNQENDVNRGIQVNAARGRWKGAVSWNDGYYSDRFTWISADVAYTLSATQSLLLTGGGNWSRTAYRTAATPVQNNSRILDLIYSYSHGPWMVEPYFQFSDVPAAEVAAIAHGAQTWGGALLASRKLPGHFSLAVRAEFIRATGSPPKESVNLLYGPGSGAWSWTVTPGWQPQHFFVRGDLSLVNAIRPAAGDAFGRAGNDRNQFRAALETGFAF
ncbi:MAG: outer membrane beta-barrel protein [Terriglobales bacterium]